MTTENRARRVIQVQQHVIGPGEPRTRTVRPRNLDDYPHVAAAHRDVARKLSSPLLMGPPICDELIAFVQHLVTEEEAAVMRHLGMVKGRSAADLARAEHRPVEEIEPILQRLAVEKHIIATSGRDEKRRYHLMPIVPGIFEMCLIKHSPENLSDWHRRFAELFEALFDTGFPLEYQGRPVPWVRYLPVGKALEAHPMALPSDKLEVVLAEFDTFGIGVCQCRTAMAAVGKGCGKPLGNCLVMGHWAERGIRDGWLRQVDRQEALAVKREAEAHGMINWMMNVASTKGQCSCSCCGCCCHALRMVNEFNAPGAIAPPHFLPRLDQPKCIHCGKCVQHCPMAAIAVDTQAKTYRHLVERCVGCGLCALACDRQQAITMEPVPGYKLPYRSWFSMLLGAAPKMLRTSWDVWRQRKSEGSAH